MNHLSGLRGLLRLARSIPLCAAMLLLTPQGALGQPDRALFATEARMRAPAAEAGGEPGHVQPRRIARADLAGLGALRESVASGVPGRLRLNLFRDVEFTASLERSASTASGYTLSGPLEGVPFGRAVLVVNGGEARGRIYTPDGNYSIRTAGGLQTVERMAPQPLRCGVGAHSEADAELEGDPRMSHRPRRGPASGMRHFSPADETPAKPAGLPAGPAVGASHKRGAASDASPGSDDGDVVDVLVVFPSFVRELEGGYARMLSLIDLDIATANEAYAASGVQLRVRLAAAEEVEYDLFREKTFLRADVDSDSVWSRMLEHLSGRHDGHMDEVHELRDRHAADLVLLHLGGEVHAMIDHFFIKGGAYAVYEVTADALEALGFSVATSGDGTVVAHELGHGMGLHHERSRGSRNEPFPYSHGFHYETIRGARADGPGEKLNEDDPFRFGTVMVATGGGRRYENYVLAFSNPDLVHPKDPDVRLGVPGDQPSSSPDGPADAARHLNELRGALANVRSRAEAEACAYEVTGEQGMLPADGGTYRLRVETQPGCAWTAAGGEWVASVSPRTGTGSADVEYRVGENNAFRRPVEMLIAGHVHARPQAGSRPVTPVCERSPLIKSLLTKNHPDYELVNPTFGWYTPCEDLDFDADYLASVRTFQKPHLSRNDGLDASGMRPGDFDGLTGLVDLKLHSIESVPPDFLFGLIGLRRLDIGVEHFWKHETAALRDIEPGAFRGLPGLRLLEIGPHRLKRLKSGMFEGLSGLENIRVWGPQEGSLTLEPGAFRGLSNARAMSFRGHSLNPLLRGVFEGLGKLMSLDLAGTGLESLGRGVFEGLGKLMSLDLAGNGLESLGRGVFEGLGKLMILHLDNNELESIETGVLDSLPELLRLDLSDNRLATLEPGAFAGLSKLEKLRLHRNRLRNLPLNVFEGLKSLQLLNLQDNPVGVLRNGLFTDLDRLRFLYMHGAGVTSIEPGLFDGVAHLEVLVLEKNRLREVPLGALRGLNLGGLHLAHNPGSPFEFLPTPVAVPPQAPVEGLPLQFALEVVPEAPFPMTAGLFALGASLASHWQQIGSGESLSVPVSLEPEGEGEGLVTVHVNWVQWPGENDVMGPTSYEGHGYSGFRVAPGPPLTLYGFADAALSLGGGARTFDLPSVFSYFLGGADYAASSDDEGVAAAAIDGRTLTVTPQGAGSAEVTVTATGPDGETMTRRFSVTVADDRPSVPLFLSGAHAGREGFARLLNRSGAAGDVRMTAVDGEGARREPVTLRLPPYGAVHFNSGDLEEGNPEKGLANGVGFGVGDWRLEFETELDIDALAYVRTRDGFVTGMNAVAPSTGNVHRIAAFNPASNPRQLSRLRVVNPSPDPAQVAVRGIDDAGASPGGPVRFTVPAGGAREFDAVQLESGDPQLDGALGDGEGKWRLTVESDAPVAAMSLLESTSTGHLTNLSSGPVVPDGDGTHHVPLFPAASDPSGRQGFLRVFNRSEREGTVRIAAFDEAGTEHGPLELSIGAGGAAHFNSDDLELGAASKGLNGGTGPGGGDWRLALDSGLDIGVLAYVRTEDGFLTSIHDTVAVRDGRRRVVTFNPGSNTNQVSVLRVVNPTAEEVEVSVVGTDDRGSAPPRRGAVWFTVPTGGTLDLDAAELEAGLVSDYHSELAAADHDVDERFRGYWDRWPLGDGSGKWRLSVATERGVLVQSLLENPTGHLTNLSSEAL
ncbi:MAG: leucine-rich repeat protein [Gammaproteobacteria bacterium]|nr:leucine-rich repeat protein [Gammaproteobacteria bacterium]MDE0271495.1 leucine-rich repeat protein [Gammaproteobacteria bacterium]